MEEPHDDAAIGDDVSYSYKSSVIGAPFEFQLASDALHWGKGDSRGRTPYRQIRRVRLGFRPMTMQNYRFITEIWTDGPKLTIASTSWKSMVEHERLDASYRAFIAELCRRIGAAGGRVLVRASAGAVKDMASRNPARNPESLRAEAMETSVALGHAKMHTGRGESRPVPSRKS